MKKLIHLSIALALSSILFTSCDPKEIIIPELNLTGGNELTITDEGGSYTLSFYTNVAWSVSVSDTKATDWITISPSSGAAGSVKVSVSVTKNEDYDDRTAYLKIVAEDQKGTVTVTQKKKGALTLSPERQEIPQEGKTIDIELKTNLEYDIIIPTYCSEWITPVKTKAIETYNLQFKIEANTSVDSRQGEIIIKDKNSTLADTVKVLQAYKDGLILTKRTYDIESGGATIDVELKSNVEFDEIFPSGVTWIKKIETKSSQTYSLKYEISENETYDSRTAKIIYKDKNSDLADTLTITQYQKDAIILAPKSYDVEMTGGTIDLIVSSNIDFEVIIPSPENDWISQLETKGLTPHDLKFEVKNNPNYDNRSGKIIIKDKKSDLADTVTVRQYKKDGLILTQKVYNIDSGGETIDVELRSNVEFDEILPTGVDWVTKVTTKGLEIHSLQYTVSENETHDSRTAKIIYKDKNSDLADTLTITQYQKDAIILGQKSYDVEMTGGTIDLKVSSNIDFEVIIPSPESDWISQLDTKAMTDHDLKFQIKNNPNYDSRSGKIVIKDKNSDLADTVKVNQIVSGIILSEKTIYRIETTFQPILIIPNPNIRHTILDSEFSWIDRPTYYNEMCYINLRHNYTDVRREGYLVFENIDTQERDTVRIIQLPTTTLINSNVYNYFPSTGGDTEILINPEVKNWTYEIIDGSEFCEIYDQSSHSFKVRSWADESKKPLRSYVIFNIKDIDNTLFQSIWLFTTNEIPSLSQTCFSVGCEKDTIKTTVTDISKNIEFGVLKLEWAREITVDNPEPNTIYFEVRANPSIEKRIGLISVFEDGIGFSDLYLEQEGRKNIISQQERYDIDAEGGIIEIDIENNIEYDITNPNVSWINFVNTKSVQRSTLEYLVSPNNTSNSRSAKIVLLNSELGISKEISVHQAASGGFVLDQKNIEIPSTGDIIDIKLKSETNLFDIDISDTWISNNLQKHWIHTL